MGIHLVSIFPLTSHFRLQPFPRRLYSATARVFRSLGRTTTVRHLNMAPLLHQQPFKTIYLVGFLGYLLFVKLPYWTVKYCVPSHRPRPAWTVKRCIQIALLRNLTTIPAKVGLSLGCDLTLEVPNSSLKNNARFAWVEGLSDDLVVGPIKDAALQTGVRPATRLPGYWQLKSGTTWPGDVALPGEKTVLHLHGGCVCFILF